MCKPVLSIVIPSKNRQKYLVGACNMILDHKENSFEIIVHDNSDQPNQFLQEELQDKRLKYYYSSDELSTIDNFNKATDLACGEFICIIGDDDGIIPQIFQVVKWASEHKVDAISYKHAISFSWPNNKFSGRCTIYPYSIEHELANSSEELDRFLKKGGVYYLKYKLPRVYHGIVRKSKFDEVKSKYGKYFFGLSPDIFSSMCLAMLIEKVVYLSLPLTVAGSSSESNKTHRTKEAKSIKLKDAPHFKYIYNYQWMNLVPKIYSGETIWAESSLQALHLFNRSDLIEKLNLEKMNAMILQSGVFIDKEIFSSYLSDKQLSLWRIKRQILIISINSKFRKVYSATFKLVKGKKSKVIKNLNSIEDLNPILKKEFESIINLFR